MALGFAAAGALAVDLAVLAFICVVLGEGCG